MKKKLLGIILSSIVLIMASTVNAALIDWVNDWQVTGDHSTAGTATGTLVQNGVTIDVTYTGHIGWIAPSPYWSEGNPAPYTGNSVVDNAPTQGIALEYASTGNTLTFSTALIDPLFALYSVGRSNMPVDYTFNQSFTLLSEGSGHWGDGSFVISGNTITGSEGHGVLQFNGSVSSISWDNTVAEYHHGFAIGAQETTNPVPEPATMLLFGTGLVGLAGSRLRKMKK